MENGQQGNSVTIDGTITGIYPPKNPKAPTRFAVRTTRLYNGTAHTSTFYCKTYQSEQIRVGGIVRATGYLRNNHWEKDGTSHWELEVMITNVTETGFDGQLAAGSESQEQPEEEPAPTDIPEGEITLDNIPF